MSLSVVQKLLAWWRMRWRVVIFVTALILLGYIPTLLVKPAPKIIRSVGPSTQHVDMLWSRNEFLPFIRSGIAGTVFGIAPGRDRLLAVDAENGHTLWQIKLPRESDVRGLLANQDAVFIVNTLSVFAYRASDGKFMWSTPLGHGHVSIMEQLNETVMRIYYGETIYELDANSGKILSTLPRDSTAWITKSIVLKETGAFDKLSGRTLWSPGPLFYTSESVQPVDFGSDVLVVDEGSAGICALDLRNGLYDWCRPEEYNSMVAVDMSTQVGYALRTDNVLLSLDLQTGRVLGTTSFPANQPTPPNRGAFASIVGSQGIVVIAFSDSNQTFGLRMTP